MPGIERNLAWFDNEDEAIEVARQWVIAWIDAHDNNLASADTDLSTRRNDMPTTTPVR